MTVTERLLTMSETPIVNMVRATQVKAALEPGDTRQQWKGEAAASLVCAGITSSRVLPTSSAGYWSPSYWFTCYLQAPPKRRIPSEVFFCARDLSRSTQLAACLQD